MISYEAVERGATVLIEDGQFGIPWEDASEDERTEVMARVRAILEAAAPFMASTEYDRGFDDGERAANESMELE